MYGAKKNGKKNSDLPALSKDQYINKIGFHRFALTPLYLEKKNKYHEITIIFSKIH